MAEQGSSVTEPGSMSPGWHVDAEIASQPSTWRQAARLADELLALLPDGRIALTGCGTSYYVAQTIAQLWESAGHGPADAFAASEMPVRADYSTVVVISRSGTTTEVAELLERLDGVLTLALVGSDGPVSRRATRSLVLDFADEESVVQTRFATAVIALFRARLGEDVDLLAEQAVAVLAAPVQAFDGVSRFVFLGTGPAVGLAHEGALKMREAAQTVTESYPAGRRRPRPAGRPDPGAARGGGDRRGQGPGRRPPPQSDPSRDAGRTGRLRCNCPVS